MNPGDFSLFGIIGKIWVRATNSQSAMDKHGEGVIAASNLVPLERLVVIIVQKQ
jgi:hypothetical protein